MLLETSNRFAALSMPDEEESVSAGDDQVGRGDAEGAVLAGSGQVGQATEGAAVGGEGGEEDSGGDRHEDGQVLLRTVRGEDHTPSPPPLCSKQISLAGDPARMNSRDQSGP